MSTENKGRNRTAVPPTEHLGSGLNFSGELPANRDAAKAYKKKEPEARYEILRINKDGKDIIKVLEKLHYITDEKHRTGVTESKLCYQRNGSKQVAGYYTIEQLTKKGVKL